MKLKLIIYIINTELKLKYHKYRTEALMNHKRSNESYGVITRAAPLTRVDASDGGRGGRGKLADTDYNNVKHRASLRQSAGQPEIAIIARTGLAKVGERHFSRCPARERDAIAAEHGRVAKQSVKRISRVCAARKRRKAGPLRSETRRGAPGTSIGSRPRARTRNTSEMDWDLLTMASLHLTATEHRYYGDIFIYCCENADGDSVPVIKVAELLRSANLPRDVTMKVSGEREPDVDVSLPSPVHTVIRFISVFESRDDICADGTGETSGFAS